MDKPVNKFGEHLILRYYKSERTSVELHEGLLEKRTLKFYERAEKIWYWVDPSNPDILILNNDALAFYPFGSTGFVFDNVDDLTPHEMNIKENMLVEVHPEIWDQYHKQGVIDCKGFYIAQRDAVLDSVVDEKDWFTLAAILSNSDNVGTWFTQLDDDDLLALKAVVDESVQ